MEMMEVTGVLRGCFDEAGIVPDRSRRQCPAAGSHHPGRRAGCAGRVDRRGRTTLPACPETRVPDGALCSGAPIAWPDARVVACPLAAPNATLNPRRTRMRP